MGFKDCSKDTQIEREEYFKFVDSFCMYPEEYASYGFSIIIVDGIFIRLD